MPAERTVTRRKHNSTFSDLMAVANHSTSEHQRAVDTLLEERKRRADKKKRAIAEMEDAERVWERRQVEMAVKVKPLSGDDLDARAMFPFVKKRDYGKNSSWTLLMSEDRKELAKLDVDDVPDPKPSEVALAHETCNGMIQRIQDALKDRQKPRKLFDVLVRWKVILASIDRQWWWGKTVFESLISYDTVPLHARWVICIDMLQKAKVHLKEQAERCSGSPLERDAVKSLACKADTVSMVLGDVVSIHESHPECLKGAWKKEKLYYQQFKK